MVKTLIGSETKGMVSSKSLEHDIYFKTWKESILRHTHLINPTMYRAVATIFFKVVSNSISLPKSSSGMLTCHLSIKRGSLVLP